MIVDVHNDAVIAVAPVSVMDKLVAIAERVRRSTMKPSTESGAEDVAGSTEFAEVKLTGIADGSLTPSGKEPNRLFNELLGSLAEAEKGLAGRKEPNRTSRLTGEGQGSKGKWGYSVPEPNASQGGPNEPNVAKDDKIRRSLCAGGGPQC